MHALLTSAQTRLDEALSGRLSDPVGAAIMAMYDALMASLNMDSLRAMQARRKHPVELLAEGKKHSRLEELSGYPLFPTDASMPSRTSCRTTSFLDIRQEKAKLETCPSMSSVR